jgi:hypothetical protein
MNEAVQAGISGKFLMIIAIFAAVIRRIRVRSLVRLAFLGLLVGGGFAATGCAFAVGAGVGMSVDTRGTVSLLAMAHVKPMGFRVSQDRLVDREYEAAAHLLPFYIAGGIELNPGAWVLLVDIPGVGFTWNRTGEPHGLAFSLNVRTRLTWPFSGGSAMDWGGVLHSTYLANLKTKRFEPKASRPEWPEQWWFHGMGPALDIAVMKGEGWYGHFTAAGRYQFISYFMMGL